MAESRLRLKKTFEFDLWYHSLEPTWKTRVDARLDNVSIGHFGDYRRLHNGLCELKWKNGMRVYYSLTRHEEMVVVLLLGGFKDPQRRDIARARLLMKRYGDEI